mmetsp:Transcript_13927/g.39977  ORF Transcript_13927/g.39977 Transcript_13927/m.39977 type:complete len:225 (-) Transcript_13927:475-1149(-)
MATVRSLSFHSRVAQLQSSFARSVFFSMTLSDSFDRHRTPFWKMIRAGPSFRMSNSSIAHVEKTRAKDTLRASWSLMASNRSTAALRNTLVVATVLFCSLRRARCRSIPASLAQIAPSSGDFIASPSNSMYALWNSPAFNSFRNTASASELAGGAKMPTDAAWASRVSATESPAMTAGPCGTPRLPPSVSVNPSTPVASLASILNDILGSAKHTTSPGNRLHSL